MDEKTKLSLADYLLNAEPVQGEVVAIAHQPGEKPNEVEIVTAVVKKDEPGLAEVMEKPDTADEDIAQLMGMLKRIGMCSKDLHYRAKGKSFYGIHELADLFWGMARITDDLAEVYFLGERGIEPPLMSDIYARAIALNLTDVVNCESTNMYLRTLFSACFSAIHAVEDIKIKHTVKSGVTAILDKISQECLLAVGLLDQTMKSEAA